MDFAAVKRGILSGFAWQGITKVVVQLASWGATIFVARLISPGDYGIMAAAAVFAQLLTVVTELGLGQGLIQRQEMTRADEDGVFYVSLLLALGAYGLLFMAAPMVAGFYAMPILSDVLRLLGLMVVFGALKTVPLALAMRRMDFRYRSLVEMGASLAMTATVITLALLGYGLWALVWGPIVNQLVMMIAFLPLLKRFPRPTLWSRPVAQIMGFGVKVTSTSMLYFIWSRADVMIIGRVLGERALGMYSMAFQLAVLPLDKVGSIFNHVMFPAMARLQQNLRQSQEVFLDLHRYLLLITYPLLFGLIAVAEDLTALLLAEAWLPIVPYLQGLCLISALRVSGMLMPAALYARGKPGLVVRYSGLCVLVLPPSFLIGAQFGLQGVVVAWALAYPGLYVVLARYSLQDLQLGWGDLLRSAAPAVGATTVMMAAVLAFQALWSDTLGVFARVVGAAAVGGSVYIGVLALLFRQQLLDFRQRILLLRSGNAGT